ncbi:hypothetical protein [Roseomonas populi]|uniref:Uncharacterized protein n=1 Tax=Roseomonas populi TaxID=3121582 RepID=A0ABT1X1J3_9PROT|nr:hypothetical protein [Roseomonas pecuniae]MCR0981972.1 hypothetical protein [Roseomonas pecuniae]
MSRITKTLGILGLAAALLTPVLSQDAHAARAWSVGGEGVASEADTSGTGYQYGGQTLLEQSGATGGGGQHG